jgi:hypothetical protein
MCFEESAEGMYVGLSEVTIVSGIKRNSMAFNLIRPGLIRKVFRIIVD